MIDTLIFDYGNTLVRFCEPELAATYTDSPEDAALLCEVFFSREYWQKLDEGKLTHEEWIASAKGRLPERLHPTLHEIAATWYYRLPAIDGMAELVKKLKARGVKLYLLSNISRAFAEHISEFPLLLLFDGLICSAVYEVAKPDPAIYRMLIDTYKLATNGCVFVDDRQENLDAAAKFGIHPYLFDGDAAKLSTYLDTVLA